MEPQNITLQDVKAIVRRRKWSFILPVVIIFLAAAAAALILPPIYKSSSTILIEDQEIPAEYVQTTVTSYVEKRLEEIKQKIMSTSRLQEIIDANHLYADLEGKETREEIIDQMRDDIQVELISAEVVDRRTGRSTTAAIAFTLSFEGKNDPVKVHRVANVLTSLFLEENLKVRQRQTREATEFFAEELAKIRTELNAVEARIAEFKEQHVHELPELLQVNMQDLHRLELSSERAYEQLRGFREREGYLEAELATISPQMGDQKRLVELRQQLVQLETTYSSEYPDVIQLKAEIAELEARLQDGAQDPAPGTDPDNPAYVTLSSQLTSVRSEIETVQRQIEQFEKQRDALSRRIAATPGVERSYKELLVERDSLKAKFDDLKMKLMEANVAQGLEQEQKGERFTLIDPPLLPEEPYKPPRLAIMLIGLVLGIGAGVGMVALREFTDDAVRDAGRLATTTGAPVLATIPLIQTAKEIEKRRQRRMIQLTTASAALIGALFAFHFWVMDFAVLWAKLMRRLTF